MREAIVVMSPSIRQSDEKNRAKFVQ